MAQSLDKVVELLEPHLSPELIQPQRLLPIREIAALLPAIYRGIFECRLEGSNARMDFHQCIISSGEEPDTLAQHIAGSALGGHPVWQHIASFCAGWSDPISDLNSVINNIWLEFDTPLLSEPPVPAIFMAFGGDRSAGRSRQQYWAIAKDALATLRVELLSERELATIYRCASACPTGVSVTHLGLMMSRPDSPVRINVKGLKPDQVGSYLQQINWPGTLDEVTALYSRLVSQVDSVVLCLDVTETVASGLGFECFIKRDVDDVEKWRRFFQGLVDQGLCSPAKRDAFLAWPGLLSPDSNSERWPADLITKSFLRSPTTLSLFFKRISHVKIGYHPAGYLDAKGYLWFAHDWIDLRTGTNNGAGLQASALC